MPTETFANLPEAKRERLVVALTTAFATDRYSKVAVGAVTDAAGVSKGSFYHYFTDKADAYRHIVEQAMAVRARPLADLPEDTPVGEALAAFLDGTRQLRADQPELYAVLARALTDPDAPTGDLAARIRAVLHEDLRLLIERAITRGEVRPDLDADLTAYLVESAFAQLGPYLIARFELSEEELLAGMGQDETARITADLTRLLLHAMGAR